MRVLVLVGTLIAVGLPQSVREPLRLVATIELPGVEGRIDHLALDSAGERLFVAALGNDTVEVVNVKTLAHVKSLKGFQEPQGIAVAGDAHAVAVANGSGKGIQLISEVDYQPFKAVALGEDADNVRYDTAAKKLYVGYGGGAIAAVDPAAGKVTGTVSLAAHPESFQLEQSGPRIFVNVPSAGHIAVIDRTAMKVVATWPIAAARANYPMTLDEARHRLYVGSRSPAKVLVYDTDNGKPLGTVDIVGDTDDMFFDRQRNRLYVAGGEGFIDVVDVREGAGLTRLGHIKTDPGARTALFSQTQSRLYLAVPHRGAQRAAIKVYEVQD